MKHKMWSRLLSMALAVMMIVSIVPNSAFAEAANEITSTSQVQEIPAEETQTPEEVTVPEAETPAEPSTEPAPTEEPVAEPTAEPTVEPTAEPTQAPAETAVPSEQPSAEPTAAPEATETPNASAQPSETPVPSESPVPSETPAPSEEPAINGQALLDEMMAIEDDETFLKAVGELTEEQTAALEALGEEALVEYAQRVESLTAAKQKNEKFTELYDKLMAAETLDDFYALLDALSDEEFELFNQWLSEEQNQEIVERVAALLEIGDGEVQEEEKDNDFISPVNFANVAPLSALSAMTPMRAMRTMRAAQTTTPTQNPDGLEMTKSIRKDTSGKYWIDLEAYTTGTITSSGGAPVPADIVLVLDMSGSMDYCMNCGKEQKDHHGDEGYCKEGTYEKVYNVQPGGTYFYGKDDDKRVYWCDNCEGWYTTNKHWRHSSSTELTPKTYENGRGTQFYELSYGGTKFEPRIDALKNAVNGFITSVQEDAIKYKVEHKISLVKFAGEKSNNIGNDTYEDWFGRNWVTQNSSQIVCNLTDVASNASTIQGFVDNLKPAGSTRIDNGLKCANDIFTDSAPENRNRIVVVFTDGEPTTTSSNDFSDTVANEAISQAKTLKNEKGATVYTIGVFSGADGANPADLPAYSDDRNNRFMHLVSSNYPNATKVKPDGGWYGDENTGELNPKLEGTDKSYYLSAGDSETLNKIFQDISDEIQGGGSSFKLDDKAVIKDVMSDYFQLPVGTSEEDVTVEYYKADYSSGNLQWTEDTTYHPGITKTVNQATGSVSVTGFDFDHNFVTDKGRVEGNVGMSGDFYGRKIKISFPVEVKPEFLGGNNVLTNSETASGIYQTASTENPVGVFTSPNLNVPVKADVQKVDRTIHLTTSITADQLFEQTITPNGTNNAYVTITYTVKDSRGIELGTYTIQQGQTDGSWSGGAAPSISPDECSNYTITCTVTPNTGTKDSCGDSAVVADEEEANSTVHVLYPTIQANDKYIALGESTDFGECWAVETNGWYDAKHDRYPEPVTTAPEVIDVKVKEVNSRGEAVLSSTTVSPKQDTDYNIVAVKLGAGETDWITDVAKFAVLEDTTTKHNADEHTCIQPTEDDQSQNPHDFTIHVYSVNGDLKIKKTLQSFNASKGDDAVFTFKAVNDDTQQVYYATIPFQKDEFVNGGSVTHETTLKGIPAGTYTVYELTSAGYVAVVATVVEDVEVGGSIAGLATFINRSDGNKTPGDNSSVLNKWLGDKFAPVTSEAANG